MLEPDSVPCGVAVPETPSDKDREAYELQRPKEWVIQFDSSYLSSVKEKGEQVRMRMILDTSTGYGTACVIDVKSGGDKYGIFSAVSFLKELGYTRFRCRTDPEPAIKAMVDAVITSVCQMIARSSKSC